MKGLKNRAILVAGAASGIGAATAQRLAEEGARVVIGDLFIDRAEQTAQHIRQAGGDAVAIQYDQSDEASIKLLIAQTVAHLGKLEGVHANAAEVNPSILSRDGDLSAMDVQLWERILRVNLIGYALIIRESLPHLLAAGGGGIVCTSSDESNLGETYFAAYGCSKAGINELCRHVASRWGKEGIRCNAIAPGIVLTEGVKAQFSPEQQLKLLAAYRSPRLGEVEDVAAAVAFLLSDESSWVNGQVWSVNGGLYLRG